MKLLLKKLEGFYRNEDVRLVLYTDCSGHVEIEHPDGWIQDYAFDNLEELENYLAAQQPPAEATAERRKG